MYVIYIYDFIYCQAYIYMKSTSSLYLLTYSNGKKKKLIRYVLCTRQIMFQILNKIIYTSMFTYNQGCVLTNS